MKEGNEEEHRRSVHKGSGSGKRVWEWRKWGGWRKRSWGERRRWRRHRPSCTSRRWGGWHPLSPPSSWPWSSSSSPFSWLLIHPFSSPIIVQPIWLGFVALLSFRLFPLILLHPHFSWFFEFFKIQYSVSFLGFIYFSFVNFPKKLNYNGNLSN